jgi:hypothetical protein
MSEITVFCKCNKRSKNLRPKGLVLAFVSVQYKYMSNVNLFNEQALAWMISVAKKKKQFLLELLKKFSLFS